MTWMNGLTLLLAAVGVFFMVLAAAGVLLLPGVHNRMQAAGQATLGVTLILLAVGSHFGAAALWRLVALVALYFLTGPVATTAMARAAYRIRPSNFDFLAINEAAPDSAGAEAGRPQVEIYPAK